jgi:integrase
MEEININSRGGYGSSKDKALTPTDRTEILKKVDGKYKIVFILGAYAGLRVGEIAQCRKSWLKRINFDNKEVLGISIPAECRDIKNQYKIWRPKTKRERTTYLFNPELYAEVEAFFNYCDNVKLSVRGIQDISYKQFGVNIHSLRATAQNYFKYELNMPTEIIAVMLGHRDVRTTLQHYTSLNTAQAESFLINHWKEKSK